MPLPNSEGEIKYKIIKNKLPLKRKFSNSRSWQGLCILHRGMIPWLEKTSATSNPSVKTSSHPALKRENRAVFLCVERVARYTGGITSWLPGEAGCQAWKTKHLFWKSKLQLSHPRMDALHFPCLPQSLFFHAFPGSIPGGNGAVHPAVLPLYPWAMLSLPLTGKKVPGRGWWN